MALILGIRKGEDFYVDNVRVVMTDRLSEDCFELDCQGEKFLVGVDNPVEILPHVFVQVGVCQRVGTQARVLLTAPNHNKILRGQLYRRSVLFDNVTLKS